MHSPPELWPQRALSNLSCIRHHTGLCRATIGRSIDARIARCRSHSLVCTRMGSAKYASLYVDFCVFHTGGCFGKFILLTPAEVQLLTYRKSFANLCQITVPPWSFFNKHHTKWLPASSITHHSQTEQETKTSKGTKTITVQTKITTQVT